MAKKIDEWKSTKTKQTEVQQDDRTYVAKLSVKAVGCRPQLDRGQNRKILCRIYGTAQGLISGENKTTGDPWTALQGEFEGVNVEEGSPDYGLTLRSGKLFLPSGIQDVVQGAVQSILNKKGGSEDPNIMFALEVASVLAQNPQGYSYSARSLMPPAQQDPLADLRQVVLEKAGALKALPAPGQGAA